MILLDTHVWVRWLAPASMPLPGDVLASIDAADGVAVSAISCWEVVHLRSRRRIELGVDAPRWPDFALEGSDVECLPITRDIAAGCRVLTLDGAVRQYPEVKELLA